MKNDKYLFIYLLDKTYVHIHGKNGFAERFNFVELSKQLCSSN